LQLLLADAFAGRVWVKSAAASGVLLLVERGRRHSTIFPGLSQFHRMIP
jgi:hypothetical protein